VPNFADAASDGSVTVVNVDHWVNHSMQLAQLLADAGPGDVIQDPDGLPANAERIVVVSDPAYWSTDVNALTDALTRALTPQDAEGRFPTSGVTSGVAADGPERLTLTVEETAAVLGISRAFAYEAVQRGDIPAIRIGRRILVPKVALARLLELDPDRSEPD
jgi:excisionase family DNA binding protein